MTDPMKCQKEDRITAFMLVLGDVIQTKDHVYCVVLCFVLSCYVKLYY